MNLPAFGWEAPSESPPYHPFAEPDPALPPPPADVPGLGGDPLLRGAPGMGQPATDATAAPPAAPLESLPGRGMDLPFGGAPGRMAPFQYSALWFPDVPLSGQPGRWGMVGQDLSLMLPLHVAPPDFWTISFRVGERHIETSAQLTDTHQAYPEDLWSVSAGLNYFHLLDNGWTSGAMVNVGSSSDRPFASGREINVGFIGFLRVPCWEHHAWLFSLMYSPTSELGIPIPGVAFDYHPSDYFRANIGLPLSVMYRPTDDWTIDCSYMLIRTIHLKVTRRLSSATSLFARYDWCNESYFLFDRPEYNDRFFLYDQRVSAGMQYAWNPLLTTDASAGFAFDRYSYEGNIFGTRQFNRVNIGDGPFAAVRCMLRY